MSYCPDLSADQYVTVDVDANDVLAYVIENIDWFKEKLPASVFSDNELFNKIATIVNNHDWLRKIVDRITDIDSIPKDELVNNLAKLYNDLSWYKEYI